MQGVVGVGLTEGKWDSHPETLLLYPTCTGYSAHRFSFAVLCGRKERIGPKGAASFKRLMFQFNSIAGQSSYCLKIVA